MKPNPAAVVLSLKALSHNPCSPFVTGPALWPTDENGTMYADGGFSIMLHPECEHTITVPTNPDTLLHIFNPTFGYDLAEKFWLDGQNHEHPLIASNS